MSEQTKAARVYTATVECQVRIEVRDADVIERVTGPGGDEWRKVAYPLRSEDDVLAHLAYNAVANGVQDVSVLDGWADVEAGKGAVLDVTDVEVIEVSEGPAS
jgi:hypothetical protein